MNPAPAVNSLKSNINDSGKHSFMLPDFSPDIAEICGIHAGDGYLRNEGYQRELDISGNIDEKEYYDSHVVPLFERVFGNHASWLSIFDCYKWHLPLKKSGSG